MKPSASNGNIDLSVHGSPPVTLCQAWSSDFFKTRLIRAAAAAALGAVSCDVCKTQASSRHSPCKKARNLSTNALFQRRNKYCILWVSVGYMKISTALNVAKSQNLCRPHGTEELCCGYGEILGVRHCFDFGKSPKNSTGILIGCSAGFVWWYITNSTCTRLSYLL